MIFIILKQHFRINYYFHFKTNLRTFRTKEQNNLKQYIVNNFSFLEYQGNDLTKITKTNDILKSQIKSLENVNLFLKEDEKIALPSINLNIEITKITIKKIKDQLKN